MRTRDLAAIILGFGTLACWHSPPQLPPLGLEYGLRMPIAPAGCADTAVPRLPSFRVSDTLTFEGVQSGFGRHGKLNAWRARRVPGGWAAGGYGWGAEPIRIYLKEPKLKYEALSVLDTLAPPDPRWYPPGRRDTVEAVQVRWDYAELHDWLEYSLSQFYRARGAGLNMWGVDPRSGRILFGLEDVMGLPATVRFLESLSPPCDLFHVEVHGKIVAASSR